MKRIKVVIICAVGALLSWPMSAQQRATTAPYFPERFDWQHKRPDEVGMNAALVAQAVQAATGSEMTTPRDLTPRPGDLIRPGRAV